MSHIATALAKSKGKDVKPPPTSTLDDVPLARIGPVENPFLQTVATKKVDAKEYVAPAVAAPRTFPLKKILLALSLVATLALGFVGWTMLGSDNPIAQFLGTAPDPAIPAPHPKATTKHAAHPLLAPPPTPTEKFNETVHGFVITSAAGGAIQRLTIGGKVFQPGDTVAEGLVLQAIETEEIVFRDAEGNLYTRRK